VNVRALRRPWSRNRAWALIIALLPVSECLADSESHLSAASPGQPTAAGTGAANSSAPPQAPTRPVIPPPRKFIPPPRKFSEQEIKKHLSQQSQGSIPPSVSQPGQATAPEPKSLTISETKPAETELSTMAHPGVDPPASQPPAQVESLNQAMNNLETPSREPQAPQLQTTPDAFTRCA